MLLSYLIEPKDRLAALKAGMEKNPVLWTDQTVMVQNVNETISGIEAKSAEVENAKQVQALKLSEARDLSGAANKLADKIENLANGFHAESSDKLLEYGIKPKKAKEQKPVPSKVLIPVIEDDTDEEGFVVSTQADANADFYEWQKGTGANAADKNTIPEMKNFKTTKKTSFVDDEVAKGIRIFYRVRAANTNGVGPWSEAVSRVQ
jgi:hypothetical protein